MSSPDQVIFLAQSTLPTDLLLQSVPLIALHLTERCNSRCVTCDYWRHGHDDMTPASVSLLLPSLIELGTRTILISGGEPLVHPHWQQIAALLKNSGLKLWLVTSGLSLAKHAARIVDLFDSITVSLDGVDRAMYAAIRGLDAFDRVCAGMRAATQMGANLSVRVTLQRNNYHELPTFVDLARDVGAGEISFLAADVSNANAFGRVAGFSANVALRPDDLPKFEQLLNLFERSHRADFESGFIAESPQKLRRLLQYFAAICGQSIFPPTRCNAPEFSAVIGATGRVSPCFFIPGPAVGTAGLDFDAALNSPEMIGLRRTIRDGRRPECSTCVCPLWRDLRHVSSLNLEPARSGTV